MIETDTSFEEFAAVMCQECKYNVDGGCNHIDGIQTNKPRILPEYYHHYMCLEGEVVIPYSRIAWCVEWCK